MNLRRLKLSILLVGTALSLVSCAAQSDPVAGYKADMAACVDNPPPTDAQIRTMSFSDLYRWHKLSLRAADQVATYNALKFGGRPSEQVPPCVRALAWKQLDLERELNYR